MDSMLEPEFEVDFGAWKAKPDKRTAGTLLRSVQPILDKGITTYASGDSSPLVKSRARKIALKAMDSYDPTRAKLRTHLMTNLQGLRRAKTQLDQIITIPEQIQLDRHHLYESSQRLTDELGRDPSDSELADNLGLSIKRIAHIRRASSGVPEGMIQVETENGQESYQPAVESNDESGWHDFVYHSLPPLDQLVMEHSLGLHGKKILSSQSLAKKLRLSPAAMSQRKSRIQNLLDQRLDLGVL